MNLDILNFGWIAEIARLRLVDDFGSCKHCFDNQKINNLRFTSNWK